MILDIECLTTFIFQVVLLQSFLPLGPLLSLVSRTFNLFFKKKKIVNQSFALRINLVVTTPLTENMPGPSATKPGDMQVFFSTFDYEDLMTIDSVYAMNGKSVEVDDTDAEGRLVLSGVIPFSDIL